VLLWGSLCHHVKREASRLHPIYAPMAPWGASDPEAARVARVAPRGTRIL